MRTSRLLPLASLVFLFSSSPAAAEVLVGDDWAGADAFTRA